MSHFSFFMRIFFHLSCFVYLSHALNNGFSVELIHRDSSKSPIYHPIETKFRRTYNVVSRSINRVNHFSKQFSHNTNQPVSTLIPDSSEYLISYLVGTPPFKAYGFMDTGSNLIWLQCQPCHTCFNQTSPIFNPSKSSSYKNISCSSSACKDTPEVDTSCNHDEDACEYSVTYGGDAKSHGDLSTETLTLDSTSGSSVLFPKTVIGCGHVNMLSDNDQSSSIVGMGSGQMSLVKQLGSSIGSKFSYCLIPFHSDSSRSNSSSKLKFGDAAVVSGEMIVSSPMVKVIGREDYYFLTLEAFSVGNNRIEYGEETNVSKQNILIDSGTPLTMLPPLFHSKLESYVAKMLNTRAEPPDHRLSLCYNTTGKQSNFPVITAHFSGADVKLDSNSTFFPIEEGIMCFSFLPSQGPSIFGNLAQHNFVFFTFASFSLVNTLKASLSQLQSLSLFLLLSQVFRLPAAICQLQHLTEMDLFFLGPQDENDDYFWVLNMFMNLWPSLKSVFEGELPLLN
ncbi:aspartic proteinase CDR1 [Medicago truncatula]|uniref:aspartic proteinase CDR1 n=1 Tax=Medicago truncatula TaxID=3880 RepID=UPI000D2F37CF|nr:aspartic proteinase CDR1 [Medicago truncatula]